MLLAVKSVLRTMSMLGFAAVIGVTVATSTTCGVGLVHGTSTLCGLPLVWFTGFPIAVSVAIVFGLPLAFWFWKLRLTHWWQFGITGLVCAVPIWIGTRRWACLLVDIPESRVSR